MANAFRTAEMSAPDRLELNEPSDNERQSHEELRTQLRLLAEENKQLRESYSRTRQTQYRRTAIGLAVVGFLAVFAALVVPSADTVLFALGGIGIFSGVLTYYITPEQFISADVGQAVYGVLAKNEADLSAELGLATKQVYIPTDRSNNEVRLFVPQVADDPLPSPEALDQIVVATEDRTRGLAFQPTGKRLFRSFQKTSADSLAQRPATIAEQLTGALVEQFELLDSTTVDVAAEEGRLTVTCRGTAYGPVDQFDHPVVSFLAVGLAKSLHTSISVEISDATGESDTVSITCRWTASEAPPTDTQSESESDVDTTSTP